jgi:hypothetical protein
MMRRIWIFLTMIIWLTVKQGMPLKNQTNNDLFFVLVQANCQNETSESTFVYRRM